METKKRSVNFTQPEEYLLMALVKEYAKVLECKVSDTNTNSEKGKCWKLIEQKFNSSNGGSFRNQIVLKKKYDNIKKRAKKKFADERAMTIATGGGPSKEIKMTDIDLQVHEILGTRIEGTQSEFDADRETEMAGVENTMTILEEEILEEDNVFVENIDLDIDDSWKQNNSTEQAVVHTDSSKYTPKMLRTKRSKALITPQSKEIPPRRHQCDIAISHRVSQWAQAKEGIEVSRMKYVQDQEEYRLQAMKEKHELEMALMRKKSDVELAHMQKEHEVKLTNMDQENPNPSLRVRLHHCQFCLQVFFRWSDYVNHLIGYHNWRLCNYCIRYFPAPVLGHHIIFAHREYHQDHLVK